MAHTQLFAEIARHSTLTRFSAASNINIHALVYLIPPLETKLITLLIIFFSLRAMYLSNLHAN